MFTAAKSRYTPSAFPCQADASRARSFMVNSVVSNGCVLMVWILGRRVGPRVSLRSSNSTSLSFSPSFIPVISMRMSRVGERPESSIRSCARFLINTGSPISKTNTSDCFPIVEAASTDLTPDTGHVHLRLDGKLISMTYGLVQEVDLTTLAAGDHALEAEFVAADHGPFSPRVTTTVHFTREAP